MVSSAVLDSGTAMRQKMPNQPAPSSVADSYSDGGMSAKNVRSMNMYHTLNMLGKINPLSELVKPSSFVQTIYHGMSPAPNIMVKLHTNAMILALDIPFIDSIAHPGNSYFPMIAEDLVKGTKDRNKLLEINSSSLRGENGSLDVWRDIVRLCKKHGVRLSLGSDAHFCMEMGNLYRAAELLDEEGFPEELVVNSTPERFEDYLEERRKRIENSFGKGGNF